MKSTLYPYRGPLLFIFIIFFITTSNAQLTPERAGYIDAVKEFGVKNDGKTITTTSLQAAIDASIAQDKGLYLRPGEYLIDKTLSIVDTPEKRDDQSVVIQGSSVNPNERSIIVLKNGSFTDPTNPQSMMVSEQKIRGYADIVNRNIQSVDFKIQENNAGARGLDWRGAEGVSIFDVHMDMTGGFAGFAQLPGSGGSIANISVKGGRIGIDLRSADLNGGGSQPTPTITAAKFEGQTFAAIVTSWNRGAVTITGSEFKLDQGVPIIRNVSRHTTWRFSYGGNIVMTDCVIQYNKSSNQNNLIFFENEKWAVSIYGYNIFVENANYVVSQLNPIKANPNGWRHFKEFAFSTGIRNMPNGTQFEPIYVDGNKQDDIYSDFIDNESPDNSLFSRHNWGSTFPSFESEGALNLADYSPVEGDWAPALQKAIDDAVSSPSGVVFVPPGNYDMYNGVTMALNTKLIGVSHHHSYLRGIDSPQKRYANSAQDPFTPTPIVQTLENLNAENILADITVQAYGSFGQHDPTPSSRMAVLWRAGSNSVIRNINYRTDKNFNFRANFVAKTTLSRDNWISLKSIPSPSDIDDFTFTSQSATKFFNFESTQDKILAETVNGSRRLLTKSIPFNNKANIDFENSNLEIKKKNGGTFSINSLEVFNGAWNPKAGGDITVEIFSGNSIEKFIVKIEGLNKPRDKAELVSINKNNVTKILISSNHQFAVDNIIVDNKTIDFEEVNGTRIDGGEDMQPSLYYDGYRDLPLGFQYHPMIKITGGVKWYNHWLHGDVWMDPHLPYVLVEKNKGIVSFYHYHVQHSQNDMKILLNEAKNVSVFGVKTEQAGILGKAVGCDNIRFIGHGGLTSAIPGSALYWIENSTNYIVSAPTDELDKEDICQYCGSGSAILPQAKYGTYEVIAHVIDGNISRSGSFERPILWKYGNFKDPWGNEILSDTPNLFTLSAKVYLEGYSLGSEMRTDLFEENLLPKNQPFDTEPWNYPEVESVNEFPTDVVDWVLLMLHDANGEVVRRKAGFLLKDGTITDTNGNSQIEFLTPIQTTYYLSVHHRSHLGVISADLLQNQDVIDFTTSITKAKGNEQLKFVSGKAMMICGDYDQNRIINNLDFNIWTLNSALISTYLSIDGNGNGLVNNIDANLWKANRSRIGITIQVK